MNGSRTAMSDFQAPLFLFILFAPPNRSSPVLPPYDILKLVGFATGAALHLYLCWVLYRRYGIRRVERTLLGLGLSIGLWHLGTFTASIHEASDENRAESSDSLWMKTSSVIAYVALAFLPPLLAHSHFVVWKWFDQRAPRKLLSLLAFAGYMPLVILPWVVAKLWS